MASISLSWFLIKMLLHKDVNWDVKLQLAKMFVYVVFVKFYLKNIPVFCTLCSNQVIYWQALSSGPVSYFAVTWHLLGLTTNLCIKN